MCTHLTKRGATYCYRRAVPDDVRHLFLKRAGTPRSEWAFSLGAKGRTTAKRALLEQDRRFNELIAAARAKNKAANRDRLPSPSHVQQAASGIEVEAMQRAAMEQRSGCTRTP